MTTVTLPREVAQRILEWLVAYQSDSVDPEFPEGIEGIEQGISTLRADLDAPAKPVDCRGCMNLSGIDTKFCGLNRMREPCTDFDKFQALPPIVLTKVTK